MEKTKDIHKEKKPETLARCFAYNEDGSICRKPATVLDPQRGCLVCSEHAPQKRR